MKFQRSDIFASKNANSSVRLQNRHLKPFQQGQLYKVITYKKEVKICKQKVYSRSNLVIEYIPEFVFVSQTYQGITIKIKQYSLELLPWLIKKDPLLKVNIVLGIYITFLDLIDIYGIFPLHPNMMKVNQKEEVAVWINKNFEALQPDQVLNKNAFSTQEFIKSFLRIFRCCLPNKSTSEMYNDSKQLLNELVKIKRKQQMHKNCHEFLKHNNLLGNSRKFNKYQSTSIIQSSNQIHQTQRYSTKPTYVQNLTEQKSNGRFSSFSPTKRTQRVKTSLDKFNQTVESKHKPNASFGEIFFKKKHTRMKTEISNSNKGENTILDKFNQTVESKHKPNASFGENFFKKKHTRMKTEISNSNKGENTIKPSICSNGQLFKRYLMFSTSKYQQMNKVHTPRLSYNQQMNKVHTPRPSYNENYQDRFPKDFIFRSEVYKENHSAYSQVVIEERNYVQVMSQHLLGIDDDKFQPVKFRKMSRTTNKQIKKGEQPKKFMNSTGWKKPFKDQDNFFVSPTQQEENARKQPKQKLKNSFQYKTASTITSFRLSHPHQYHNLPSKSEQNLNNCARQSNLSNPQKEKDKKIEEMKIVEQNELESDFNNMFSMESSNFKIEEEDQKKIETIISEFYQVLF